MSYYVYIHIFPNKKRYIGITSYSNPNYRWNNGNGYKNQRYIYNAIQKYGWQNIDHSILYENLSKAEAEQKEIELIKEWKLNNRLYGYNQSIGGESGRLGVKTSEKTKRKLSIAFRGKRNPMFGKIKSEEIKYKCGSANRGKKIRIETKIKVSKAVEQYSVDGEFIDGYYSLIEAQRQTLIDRTSIGRVCKNRQKTAGGYIWKYLEAN